MTNVLMSLRAVLVSGSPRDHDVFRQAAVTAKIPVEVVGADGAASACRALADGADLVFVDGALEAAAVSQVVAAGHAAPRPPFSILLVAPGIAAGPPLTDAVARKPVLFDEARQFVERVTQVRVPSRVLIVDDSSTMRSIVRKTLAATRFPFEVSEAAEGFAAIKLAGETDFDIVFLDYNMPEFSGLETLAEFRREQRRMTVVVMTSAQDEALARRVRELGAGFLRKPFFPADIEALLIRHYGLVALNPKRR